MVLEQLSRLDDKPIADRLAAGHGRVQAIQAELTPLKSRIATADGELPRIMLKAQILDAIAKARGTAAPPAASTQKADGPIDALLDQAIAADPKALADFLAKAQARITALQDDQKSLQPRISALEGELARQTREVELLESLLKAKSHLAKPSTPPPPTPPASMPAKAAMGAAGAPMAAAPTAPVPMVAATKPADQAAAPAVNFADHVLPIFSARCLGCHNSDKAKGGLVLETHASVMAGGSSGAVIMPGAPDRSRLFRLVSHLEEPYMPPLASKLEDDKLNLIRQWIAGGAPADANSARPTQAAQPTVMARAGGAMRSPAATNPDEPPVPRALAKGPIHAADRSAPAIALAVSRANVLAVAGAGQILFYDTARLDFLGVAECPLGRVERLTFSRDGALLIVAGGVPGQSGSAVLYDVESGRLLSSFDRLYDTALAAALSADGSMAAVGGTNRKVRVHDVATGAKMFEITAHSDWVTSLDFSPDGLWLASGDRAGNLYVWEADTGRAMHALRGHVGAVTAVCFRADGQCLASTGIDGTVRLWEMDEGRQIAQWTAHERACFDVSFAPDGRLATCGADGLAKVWKSDGGQVAACEKQTDWVYRVAFAQGGARVVAGGWIGDVCAFDATSGRRVGCVAPPGTAARAN